MSAVPSRPELGTARARGRAKGGRRRSSLLELLLLPIVRRALATRFDRTTIRAVVHEAFGEYERQRPSLPREPSTGGRLMVNLAALTIGLYRALERRGVPAEEAQRLTAAVTTSIYAKMAVLPTALSRLGSRSRHARLRRATDLFRRFPFSAPSYEMVDVAAGSDVVAFDVRRCPVAEYFAAQGLAELCVQSWCNLDFALAQKWGARLERPLTIAGGADHCDFRWKVVRREHARSQPGRGGGGAR